MLELIASDRWRGRWVRVSGFVVLRFEGNAVYLHEEDYHHLLTKNAIWLTLEEGTPRIQAPSYAIAEGRFEPDQKGHMGLFSGTLEHVNRLTHLISIESMGMDQPTVGRDGE